MPIGSSEKICANTVEGHNTLLTAGRESIVHPPVNLNQVQGESF